MFFNSSKPVEGQPPSGISNDIESAAASPKTSTQSSTNGSEKLLLPQIDKKFSWIAPKTWSIRMRITAVLVLILASLGIVSAIAVPITLHNRHHSSSQTQLVGQGNSLRIMPLGASITWGLLSTDGNGYRNDLMTLLKKGGVSDAVYVGSRNNGTMEDNAVEGWPGYLIDAITHKARESVPKYLPNVILLNAGTNDCVRDVDIDSTTQQSKIEPELTSNSTYDIGTRMRLMVEYLIEWSPRSTVVMSTLVNNMNSATQTRVDDANAKFRDVAKELQGEGLRVVLAEMDAAAGGPNKTTMADVTHPDDIGYGLMANRWYAALVDASQRGFIVQPE